MVGLSSDLCNERAFWEAWGTPASKLESVEIGRLMEKMIPLFTACCDRYADGMQA